MYICRRSTGWIELNSINSKKPNSNSIQSIQVWIKWIAIQNSKTMDEGQAQKQFVMLFANIFFPAHWTSKTTHQYCLSSCITKLSSDGGTAWKLHLLVYATSSAAGPRYCRPQLDGLWYWTLRYSWITWHWCGRHSRSMVAWVLWCTSSHPTQLPSLQFPCYTICGGLPSKRASIFRPHEIERSRTDYMYRGANGSPVGCKLDFERGILEP